MTEEAANSDNRNNSLDETAAKSDLVGVASRGGPPLPQKKTHPMEALLRKADHTASPLKVEDIVEGTVLGREGPRLFVNLGVWGTGVVYGKEFYAAQEIIKNLKEGDALSAKVVEVDNEEGYIELSLREAGEERKWIELKKKMQEGAVLELPVLEANRGGLILEAEGIRGFLPASQLSSKNYPRVEGGDKEKVYQELQKLIGTPLRVKIIDVLPQENKLIFSERELDQEALRQHLAKYKIGDEVEGEITGVVDFGAFMKFGFQAPGAPSDAPSAQDQGLEGLIHISEIDWTLVEDPREALKPGDKVRAKIIDIQGDKVSLSLKALKEDPWLKITEKYKKGDTIRGKVTRHNAFGAFVEVGDRIQGLVHISEFGSGAKMKEALELGQEYDFKILLIDPKEHRMSLGIVRSENQESEIRNQDVDHPPVVIPSVSEESPK